MLGQEVLKRERDCRHATEDLSALYVRFSLLKPKMYKEGDQWCVILGDFHKSDFVGFGDTPHDAIVDWDKCFNKKIKLDQTHLITRNSKGQLLW